MLHHGENGKMLLKNFWKNKRVFLTGQTGFKGSWLSIILSNLNAEVKGFALEPKKNNNLYNLANLENKIISDFGDIRDFESLKKSILSFEPEIVIHLAAQPIVIDSYLKPFETYQTNFLGTLNLLEILRESKGVKSIVNVTTDKCYENVESLNGYKETDQLGGLDPYSNSKTCSEFLTNAYRKSFFSKKNIGISTARSGNVIGGGDWGNYRLVPDVIEAFSKNELLKIRNPHSIRPWQHVIEPLSGYLLLAEKMYLDPLYFSQSWNFGPNDKNLKSVHWIINQIEKYWKNPHWIVEDNNKFTETNILKLDISKSNSLLGWNPKWDLNKTLDLTVSWYKSWLSDQDVFNSCLLQINEYFGKKI